jgi:hypothetical protein
MSYTRKVVRLEIKPGFSKKFLEKYDNLGKLRDWWKNQLQMWGGVFLISKNLKVKKNNAANTLIITYDCPASTKDEAIYKENEMLSNPDDDGNYPIYIKNDKIVLIDQVKSDLISATLDRKKTLIRTKKLRVSKKKKGGTRIRYKKN